MAREVQSRDTNDCNTDELSYSLGYGFNVRKLLLWGKLLQHLNN